MVNNGTAIQELSLMIKESFNLTEGQKRLLRETIKLLGRNETALKELTNE